jgi:hypothetical protein
MSPLLSRHQTLGILLLSQPPLSPLIGSIYSGINPDKDPSLQNILQMKWGIFCNLWVGFFFIFSKIFVFQGVQRFISVGMLLALHLC